MLVPLIILMGVGLCYGVLQGKFASALVVAAMVSSRSLLPRQAVILAAFGMGLGAFVLGSAVASTIASGVIAPGGITLHGVIAGIASAVIWNSTALYLELPVSISHALIGGLIGAVWMDSGPHSLLAPGMLKIAGGLFISPVFGMIGGYFTVKLAYAVTAAATPRINRWFQRAQIAVSFIMAMAIGSNDSQKLTGTLMIGLVAAGVFPPVGVPVTVALFATSAILLGYFIHGWSLVRKLGTKFYKIRPIHGFGAQLVSSATILTAGSFGVPVSASQVVTTAILGAGSADRLQMIRWGVVGEILWGWVLTIPITALIGAVFALLLKGF